MYYRTDYGPQWVEVAAATAATEGDKYINGEGMGHGVQVCVALK